MKYHQLFACHFLYIEVFKYKEKILKASKIPEPEFLELLHGLLNKITFISEIHIDKNIWEEASNLCSEIDEKDTSHIALSLYLKAKIWTGDTKLTKKLIQKSFNSFFDY